MNRACLIAAFLCLVAAPLFAQTDATREALVKEGAIAVCACLEGKGEITPDKIQMEVGFCMVKFLSANAARMQTEYDANFEVTNEQDIYQFGVELGQVMVLHCPEVMQLLVNQELADTDKPAATDETYVATANAVITRVNLEETVTVEAKLDNGEPIRLYWREYFPGSELLLDDPVGKTFTLEFVNEKVFDGRIRGYQLRGVLKKAVLK